MGRRNRGRQERLFTIRCSEVEYAGLKARAQVAGLPMSEWARSTLLSIPLPDPPPEGPETDESTDPDLELIGAGPALDPEVLDQLQARAVELGIPLSGLVRTLLGEPLIIPAPRSAPRARDARSQAGEERRRVEVDSIAEDLELATTVKMEKVEPAPARPKRGKRGPDGA